MLDLHVDDEGGVLVAVVQFEFVHTKETSLFFRDYEGCSIYRILVFEPLQVKLFHCVLHDKRMNDYPLSILFLLFFKLLKVLPDIESGAN